MCVILSFYNLLMQVLGLHHGRARGRMLEAARKSRSDGGMPGGPDIRHIRIMDWPEELSITTGNKLSCVKIGAFL